MADILMKRGGTMSPKSKKVKPDLEMEYIVPDHIVDCYINGVHGGITSKGKVFFHAYSERPGIPEKAQIFLQKDEDGNLKMNEMGEVLKIKQETYQSSRKMIRLVQASLIMDYETAVSIYHWLGDKIDAIKSFSEQHEVTND
jgi:hypothetical protein